MCGAIGTNGRSVKTQKENKEPVRGARHAMKLFVLWKLCKEVPEVNAD